MDWSPATYSLQCAFSLDHVKHDFLHHLLKANCFSPWKDYFNVSVCVMGEEQGQAKQRGWEQKEATAFEVKKPFSASAFPVNQIVNILVQAQSRNS